MITCTYCNTNKETTNFYPNHKVCKVCVAVKAKKRNEEKKKMKQEQKLLVQQKISDEQLHLNDQEEVIINQRDEEIDIKKTCKKCKKNKNLDSFDKARNNCKDCRSKYNKQYLVKKKKVEPIQTKELQEIDSTNKEQLTKLLRNVFFNMLSDMILIDTNKN